MMSIHPTSTHTLVSRDVQPTNDEIKQLFDACLLSGSVPVLLSLAGDPYNKSFISFSTDLPTPLQFIVDPELLHCNYLELVHVDVGQGKENILDISVQQQK